MDVWIVALRGDDDALLDARAALGAPSTQLGSLEMYSFETADPATAARMIAQAAARGAGLAGAVALQLEGGDDARERAVALACAAADGEMLFDPPTRARLEGELLFVRPKPRAGWSLPLGAVALSPAPARRADCRDAVAHVLAGPALVAREREIAALLLLASTPGPIVVRAANGMGGGRVIAEAAGRACLSLDRLPQAALADAESLWKAVAASQESADWLVIDPVPASAAALMPRLAQKLLGRQLILRAAPDVRLDSIPPERQVAVAALREYDARAVVRGMLGPSTSEALVRRLARRAGGAPRALVESVRAAVQLGEMQREADARWAVRARRVLRPADWPRHAMAARVADLPPLLFRALSVLGAVGDGARAVEAFAALRGTLSTPPADLLVPLAALGFMERTAGRIQMSAAIRELAPAEAERIARLAEAGALEAAARAEANVGAGRRREAALAFALAAECALRAGLRAAAVRLAAAAHAQGGDDIAEVWTAMTDVAASLRPVLIITPLGADVAARPRALDPDTLEQAAAASAERNDTDGAARLQALAELLRGNSRRAMHLADDARADGSSRGQLVAALAQAAAGQAHRAVRSALGALATARREGEPAGEAAALALLGTIYRALGRDDEARTLAESARRAARPMGERASQVGRV